MKSRIIIRKGKISLNAKMESHLDKKSLVTTCPANRYLPGL
jgi:hypothetical protein